MLAEAWLLLPQLLLRLLQLLGDVSDLATVSSSHTVALNFKLNVVRGLIRTASCCICGIGSETSGLNTSL